MMNNQKIVHILWPLAAFFVLAISSQSFGSDQTPAPKQDHPIALIGATIHTVSHGTIENATILFDKGKIVAIGQNVELPEGTEQIDVSGKHIYPGLIAGNTALGLVEINAVRATADYAEVGDINPNVRAEISTNPDSELLPVTRANGITMALTLPSSGLISGTSALIELDGWTWEDMTIKAPVGMHVNWPSLSGRGRRFGRPPRSLADRQKAYDTATGKIKEAFTEARAYMQAKEAEAQDGIPYHDSDLRWEAMIPVLKKEIPVMVHAEDILQIQAAVDWAAEEDLRLVIVGGYDSWRVTDLLKSNDVAVIVAGVHRLPTRRWEDFDTPFVLPAKLHQAGVKYCIASGGGAFNAAHERNVPFQAATAAAYGLPRDEALKSITLYPAQIFGVDDRVGSLDVGKDATLIVTTGDPLEIISHVEMEFIQGRKIELSSKHTQLYEKYKTKYKRLGLSESTY